MREGVTKDGALWLVRLGQFPHECGKAPRRDGSLFARGTGESKPRPPRGSSVVEKPAAAGGRGAATGM